MTTPLTLHAAPAVGFDEPCELLAACHQRVARMLGLLQRLQPHLQAHGPDRAAADAALQALAVHLQADHQPAAQYSRWAAFDVLHRGHPGGHGRGDGAAARCAVAWSRGRQSR